MLEETLKQTQVTQERVFLSTRLVTPPRQPEAVAGKREISAALFRLLSSESRMQISYSIVIDIYFTSTAVIQAKTRSSSNTELISRRNNNL